MSVRLYSLELHEKILLSESVVFLTHKERNNYVL